MSDLIVVGFDKEFKADEVLLELYRGESGGPINLEDAAVVITKANGQPLRTSFGYAGEHNLEEALARKK